MHPATDPSRSLRVALIALGAFLPSCTQSSAAPIATTTDYAAAGDLAVAAPIHEDWAAGLRVGASLVHDKDHTSVGAVWLMRVPTGPGVTVTHKTHCQCDGSRASVKQTSQWGKRTFDTGLEVTRQPDAPTAFARTIDGKAIDETKGNVLLVDMRGEAPTAQLAVELPPFSLGPIGGDANARARVWLEQVLAVLVADPRVSPFVAGK